MELTRRFGRFGSILAMLLIFFACSKKQEAPPAKTDQSQAVPAAEEKVQKRGTATATFGEATVRIDYGRPELQGRDMLAKATDGMVWRMGMDEATEIYTDADLKFGNTVIPKGHYSIWMKKMTGDQWQLLFNKETGIWGTQHKDEADFAAVPMTLSDNPQSVEKFTIEIEKLAADRGVLKALWGTKVVSVEFQVEGTTH